MKYIYKFCCSFIILISSIGTTYSCTYSSSPTKVETYDTADIVALWIIEEFNAVTTEWEWFFLGSTDFEITLKVEKYYKWENNNEYLKIKEKINLSWSCFSWHYLKHIKEWDIFLFYLGQKDNLQEYYTIHWANNYNKNYKTLEIAQANIYFEMSPIFNKYSIEKIISFIFLIILSTITWVVIFKYLAIWRFKVVSLIFGNIISLYLGIFCIYTYYALYKQIVFDEALLFFWTASLICFIAVFSSIYLAYKWDNKYLIISYLPCVFIWFLYVYLSYFI